MIAFEPLIQNMATAGSTETSETTSTINPIHLAEQSFNNIAELIWKALTGDVVAQCELGERYLSGEGIEKNPTKGFEYLQNAANAGHSHAQFMLGLLFDSTAKEEFIDNVTKNDETALYWYGKAAQQGYTSAYLKLAKIYKNGQGKIFQNINWAFYYYQKAAEQGAPEAQYEVGLMFHLGLGQIVEDEKIAFEYYHVAAMRGHPKAQFKVACMFEEGFGIDQNTQKALEYYQKAAEQGHADAQNKLTAQSSFESKSKETKPEITEKKEKELDTHEDIAELTRKADAGDSAAQDALGLKYLRGKGITKDHTKALKYLKSAATQGNSAAQYSLAFAFDTEATLDTIENITKNDAIAIKWYARAAQLGHLYASMNLAYIYYNGQGKIPKNPQKALTYFLKAAELGDAAAQYEVGCMYHDWPKSESAPNSSLIKHNIKALKTKQKSFGYFEMAADNGHRVAQYTVAQIYDNDHRNFPKAREYYQKAAEQGHTESQYKLAGMLNGGSGAEKDSKKAGEYLQMAAEKGHVNASYQIALKYLSPHQATQDLKKGREYLQMSASKDHSQAQFRLAFELENEFENGGDPQSIKQAIQLHEALAEKQDVCSLFWLAEMYRCGKFGVKVDLTKAFDDYQRGAEKGDELAKQKLRSMLTEVQNSIVDDHQLYVPRISPQEIQWGKLLKNGSFGAVHEGIWRNIRVAVKIILQDPPVHVSGEDPHANEILMAAQMRHKNIVQFYGHGQTEKTEQCPSKKYLVMELMKRGSLNRVLQKSQLDWKMRIQMIRDLINAVLFIHQENVLHRDIKSRNILVNRDFSVKLSDFGFAIKLQNRQLEQDGFRVEKSKIVGTKAWMAPEVLANGEYSKASDNYSLGVTIWEIVSGKDPSKETIAKPFAILEDCPKSLNEPLSTIISALLQEDPAKRPTAATVAEYFDRHCVNCEVFRNFVPGFKNHVAAKKPEVAAGVPQPTQPAYSLNVKLPNV